ncbi:MAG: GspE/PulE family protein [Patescibacteria group bacterium]
MALKEEQFKKIVIENGILLPDECEKLIAEAKLHKISPEEYLVSKGVISEELLYQTIASSFKIPFINLKGKIIPKEVLFLIPEEIARNHSLVIFEKEKNELKIATVNIENLDNLQIIEFIKRKTGLENKIYLTTPSSLESALKQYSKDFETEIKKILSDSRTEILTKREGEEVAKLPSIIKIVNTILEYAISKNASDIHLEPQEDKMVVRYRIDGILREVMTLPKSVEPGIVARIKILSNLKIDEHQIPQDGRFKISSPGYEVSLRVSVFPVFDGEKIVLRVLKEKGAIITLEKLGFLPKQLEIVKRNIKRPYGMILVTGPTGSGKTTTLYAILNILNVPGVNITTIEDPIEYRIPGINQSQVKPKLGFTFATGLRSILRQNPDIIMVGEIRDEETAGIAINAAMTGHLVLSTLHTNDAAGALPRLLDMGVLPYLIGSTVNLIIAQRLVRKICKKCIQSYVLNKELITQIERELNINFNNLIEVLKREKMIGKDEDIESLRFYRGKGCKECDNSGYKGRIGIFEVLEVSKEIAKLINKRATAEEIKQQAIKEGMLTLLEDGFIKAKNGITTIEEVLRVSKE